MKTVLASAISAACLAVSAPGDILTDWAFHAPADGTPAAVTVPGEPFAFLLNGSDRIPDGDGVVLYVLTAQNFAGDMDEQVYVRWWDGAMSHWVMGTWQKNIQLDGSRPDTRFQGLPADGKVTADLWKVEIPPWITQPGDNFYAVQLKGFAPDSSDERFLLRQPGGDFCHSNNFGQVWSASEEFDGQDWVVQILP